MTDEQPPRLAPRPPRPEPRPAGVLPMGRLAGIPVRLHWTFPLLLLFIAGVYWAQGAGVILYMTALVLVIFACVVLHELGHALMARRFGIRTRSITLFPIGGVAQLEGMPEKPGEEVLVALAGPAVNVVIAGLLIGLLLPLAGPPGERMMDPTAGFSLAGFFWHVAVINIFLVVFNLIPAFPMDGGRVLRAVLAMSFPRSTATVAAARVGQVIAVGFGLLGLMVMNPFLILIAAFVFFGGMSEARAVTVQETLAGLRVGDAMMTEFEVLDAGDTLGHAAERLLAGSQHEFPVARGGEILGVMDRDQLLQAVEAHGENAPIAAALTGPALPVDASLPVITAMQQMRQRNTAAAPVFGGGRLVGLLTFENVEEIAGLRRARRRWRALRG